MNAPAFFDVALDQRLIGIQLAARLTDSRDRPFIIVDGHSWSFAEVDDLARAFARGLKRRGVGAGDHVVLMLPNCPEFVFAWFGAALRGAVTIPIDPRLSGALLDYMLGDAAPACLVIAAELLPALASVPAARRDRIGTVVVVPGAAPADRPGCEDWHTVLEHHGADPEYRPGFEDTSMVMYTSGSSGAPKGVIMSSAQTFSSGIVMVRGVDLGKQDVLFAPLPLFHGMSSRIGVLPALLLGIPIVIGRHFSASAYWREATLCGATVGLIVPTIPNLLMAQPAGAHDRAHRMRAMFNSRPDAAFTARFGTELIESYGMTEISHVISAAYHERRAGSCGRVQPNWEVRLLDDDGSEVAPGETGEIVVRARIPTLMMRGYLNKPDATREAIRDGWFHTADYAYADADGYFYFSGRKAERIRRLGENISALEIEAIVLGHEAVAECAALAHPAAMGEDDIRLVVVKKDGASLNAAALQAWLADRLPRFMQPRYIEFLAQLPRTESGKVAKRVLIEAGLSGDCWDGARGH